MIISERHPLFPYPGPERELSSIIRHEPKLTPTVRLPRHLQVHVRLQEGARWLLEVDGW
jgi:hypothetical protein